MNGETCRMIPNYVYHDPINSRSSLTPIHGPIDPEAVICASGTPIECKFYQLKRRRGFVGEPIIPESSTPDRVGRYRHYRDNNRHVWSIYWHPDTGANEVHGAIRDKWASLGWERFGYPTSDEIYIDVRGRVQHFIAVHLPRKPRSSILWTPQTGAHAVYGDILSKYESTGAWHDGPLGYPIRDEENRPEGGRIQRFEHGAIIWIPGIGAYVEGLEHPIFPPGPATPPPSPVTPPPPSQPKINVSNRSGKLVVTGLYFNPDASISIRAIVGAPGNEFRYSAYSIRDGSFSHEIDVSGLPPGIIVWVSATDGRRSSSDLTGFLWSNTVPISL
ncbi:LGFP repeat-containing protein [Niallia oryzisoli]|uniref:LGFP repeat-containing protein n=1 Tax=Niallia oryzisoli TaxID=1737571 RepID=UPI003735C212